MKKAAKNHAVRESAAIYDAAALVAALSTPEARRAFAARLTHVRAGRSQPEMARFMGIGARTLSYYESGERLPDVAALHPIAEEGWSLNWLVTGEGYERLEAALQSHSQDLSEGNLNIALEYTDDIIRATRATYVPRSLYAKLLRLMYQGVSQGLPVAEIHEIGQLAVRAALSGTGEQGNGSQSGMDGPGQGRR